MKRLRSHNAFLLIGTSPAGELAGPALSELVACFEARQWPLAYVMEPGPQTNGPGRPGPGDLIIQTHCPSLAREPIFMNLYHDFGEPKLILAGAWERNFLIGTVVDCYLSGFAPGLAYEACFIAGSSGPVQAGADIRDCLGGFSYAVSAADLQEKERSWWF